MFWLDWIIVVASLFVVIYLGVKGQKYVKGVADFLAAGRCAGRYVLAVAGGEAAMGLISVVAMVERDYNAGFAFSFWNKVTVPLGLLFGLTGYCVYRFRETRALTMGQFLEMRYSRSFRIFAAFLQATSGIINYAIFPAVGARFLIYFLDLPAQVSIFGWMCPMTALLMIAFLGLALAIVLAGGQVTIMITDCVQGLLSYPMYVIIVGYILYRFSWFDEMAPVLMNRVPGESYMNPYDISKLRDFNLVYVLIGVFASVLNRMSWSGSMGYNAAARNAHEEKIGGLLGGWRSGLSTMMYTLLSVAALTYLNHAHFSADALKVRNQLAVKVAEDVAAGDHFAAVRTQLEQRVTSMSKPDYNKKLSGKNNQETPYFKTAQEVLGQVEGGKAAAGNFRTIYSQMLVPIALREMFPIGITGIFCALMIFLMVSTDTTYMHSWGSVLLQDIILPLHGKSFSPKTHLFLLRLCITFVCVFSFFFSLFFSQMDYIQMFFSITGAIWMGGAGPVIVFGLYSKRGTTAGAFAAMIFGSGVAVAGCILQNCWAESVYPWLEARNLVEPIDAFLKTITAPFGTYVVWEMNPHKFPINGQEVYFLSMVIAIILYVVVSALTCRHAIDMDKLLHRGKYAIAGQGGFVKEKWTLRNVWSKLIGITSEYTLGDRILAWSVFFYSLVYGFGVVFVLPIVWNSFYTWPDEWWSYYFLFTSLIIVGVIGIITTVWFMWGGIRDLRRLFIDLDARENDVADDGSVREHLEDAANAEAAKK